MSAITPQLHGVDESKAPAQQPGSLFESIVDPPAVPIQGHSDTIGGVSGTPLIGDSPIKRSRIKHDPLPVETTLLDPEKQPANEDEDSIECRLPDEWIPPSEYQRCPISDREARFWHSSHQPERRCIYDALRALGRYRQLHAFVNCGSCSRVLVRCKLGDEFEFRVVAESCHNRWCPRCSKGRSTVYASNVREFVANRNKTLRLVTLTLRHNDTPLKDQIDRINRSFLALRRRDWWRQRVEGGVSFIEIKVGQDNRYHVHCHIIVEGAYVPQNELSHEWHAVTGDSPVCDVRMIGNVDKVAGYVAKYGSKPIDRAIIFQPLRLRECIQALHGRRLATTFGSWKHLKIAKTLDPTSGGDWLDVGSVAQFVQSPWLEQMALIQPLLAERILSLWPKPKNESS